MSFTPKDWRDLPDTSTPLSAAALEDLETRLAAYTDSAGGGGAMSTSGRKSLLAPYTAPNAVVANNSNWIYGCRVEAGMSGTLHDLSVYIGTAGGNLRVGIYDLEAASGVRTLLHGSASVDVSAATPNAYKVVSDPNIAIVAGRQYDLVVFCDNNTVSLGRVTVHSAGASTLPASFLPTTGGAAAEITWGYNLAYAALPSTISEANAAGANNGSIFWVGGRIV